jgi:mannose/fructose/N-acetylgalactosamine-specific phosphotransferase system component IID
MAAPPVTGFVRALLRLLTVQACFNYERMIGLGLSHAIEPLLRTLPGGRDGPRYRDAMQRSTRYFNAHPYMVGLAVGALARAEHDEVPDAQVERLRTALVGPLGAVGDRLIWAGTLPAASAVGLALSANARAGIGAAALLAVYNVPHVVLRVWGLVAGWRHGTALGRALAAPVLRGGLTVVGPLAACTVGFALPPVAARLVGPLDLAAWVAAVAGVVLAVVTLRLVAPRLGALRLGLAAAAAVALGAAL